MSSNNTPSSSGPATTLIVTTASDARTLAAEINVSQGPVRSAAGSSNLRTVGSSISNNQLAQGPGPIYSLAASDAQNLPPGSINDPLGLNSLPRSGSMIPRFQSTPRTVSALPRVNMPPFRLIESPIGKENTPVKSGI